MNFPWYILARITVVVLYLYAIVAVAVGLWAAWTYAHITSPSDTEQMLLPFIMVFLPGLAPPLILIARMIARDNRRE